MAAPWFLGDPGIVDTLKNIIRTHPYLNFCKKSQPLGLCFPLVKWRWIIIFPHLSRFGWCRDALPYQQQSSLAVGQGWNCGGVDIPGQAKKKKILLSFAPSLLSSLRTSLSLPRREAVSLCERAQWGRKKRNCPSSSADPQGLSAEHASAYEESEAHWRLILNGEFNPSYTELPPAVPSLWGTCDTKRHHWYLSMFCFPRAGTAFQ